MPEQIINTVIQELTKEKRERKEKTTYNNT